MRFEPSPEPAGAAPRALPSCFLDPIPSRMPIPALLPLLAVGGASAGLTLVDVALGDVSQGGAFDLALGHEIELVVAGEPGALVVLAASFTPPPDPPPVIGGVPVAIDPAHAIVLVDGLSDPAAVVGPDGTFARGAVVPAGLAPGAPLHVQALLFAPGAGLELAPSNGVAATIVQALVFDFDAGDDGFAADLSDYMTYQLEGIEPESGPSPLPAPLDPGAGAMRVAFKNGSDDVFFFLKRRIDGLAPLASRALRVDVRFASNAPEDWAGAGGGPGLDVYMKAGAVAHEPLPIPSPVNPEYVTINVDKGNQAEDGTQAVLIGNVAIPAGPAVWTLRENRMKEPLRVAADASGAIWVLVGTDSGYEGHNELYYDRVVVKLLD